MGPESIVLTCEHGGNRIPVRYKALFDSRRAQKALTGHRGYDPGALAVARELRSIFGAPLFASQISRLLVDLNRSAHHPQVFSEFSVPLGATEREELMAEHYFPGREDIEAAIAERVRAKQLTLHLAIHSFTPRLRGETRTAEVGLLYDPQRPGERELCRLWKHELQALRPDQRVRCNYPYRGNADGLTTALRKRFPARSYLGIEVELNQQLAAGTDSNPRTLARWLANSLPVTPNHR